MKKFAATILAVLYLAASTGATIHMHYCMGKLQASGVWPTSAKKYTCSTCGMTKKKGCCEDKCKIVKIEKQYDLQVIATSLAKCNLETTYHSLVDYHQAFIAALIIGHPFTNSPPGLPGVPLYIANCVYRI